MAYKLIILNGAYNDLDDAIAWYCQFSKTLCVDLLLKFENALQQVVESPLQHQLQKGNYRKINLKRFPYKVVYKVSDKEILIVAFAHQKRRQHYWRNR